MTRDVCCNIIVSLENVLIIKYFLCEGGSSSRKHIFYMAKKDDAYVAYYASPVILITFECPLFY